MFYEVKVDKRLRVSGEDRWYIYDQTRKEFKTKQEVAAHLGDQYYFCKTTMPVYQDDHEGQVGRIYSWKEKEDGKTLYYQDWVIVYEAIRKPVLVSKAK